MPRRPRNARPRFPARRSKPTAPRYHPAGVLPEFGSWGLAALITGYALPFPQMREREWPRESVEDREESLRPLFVPVRKPAMNGPNPPSEVRHVAVLPNEVLAALAPAAGQVVVDATVGAGGHARLLAERIGPTGRLIGLDQDPGMLELARSRLEVTDTPFTLVHANFEQLRQVLDECSVAAVDGILADLGFASDQVEAPGRGLSFQQEGPLDMRLDPTTGEPAAALLKRFGERDLADLFWQFGEERFSRRIARKIVETRERSPLETTTQLAELVRRCVPRPRIRRHAIDPATRVFQALRIAVNDELGVLEHLLKDLPRCLKPGGRAAIISFHSLEDRLVKRAFQDRQRWQVLTKKPVQATEEEVRNNPRARSAKLRAAVLRKDEG